MKLSIITINLNNSNGLQTTLESVIKQSYDDYELIVIDGGSTDGSIDLLGKYTKHFSYYKSEQDNGIYHAMNKGIHQAKGEYCFFLNSGDYLVNEKVLESVFKGDFHEDIVFGNLQVFYKGKLIGKSRGKEKLTFLDIYSSLIKHQSSFINRQLFIKFGYYNEQLKIVSDWEFFLKTIGFGSATYRYLDIDITCFDNDGLSNNSGDLTVQERRSVIESSIPVMMQPDYEFLLKYHKYFNITQNKVGWFIMRVMAKCIRVYNILFKVK